MGEETRTQMLRGERGCSLEVSVGVGSLPLETGMGGRREKRLWKSEAIESTRRMRPAETKQGSDCSSAIEGGALRAYMGLYHALCLFYGYLAWCLVRLPAVGAGLSLILLPALHSFPPIRLPYPLSTGGLLPGLLVVLFWLVLSCLGGLLFSEEKMDGE